MKMILSTFGDATRAAPASPKPVTVRQRSGLCPQAFNTSVIMAVKYLGRDGQKVLGGSESFGGEEYIDIVELSGLISALDYGG